jgi:phi13 family phage major tail protein
MEQKYGEFVGVDSVYTADVTVDDIGNYTVTKPEYFAPVAEIAGEPEVNTVTTYYDNKAANTYVTEGMTELQLTVSNVPASKLADVLGKHYDDTTGRVYDSGEADPPDKAIGFRYNMGKSGYRYYWYLKGTFSGGAEEAASRSSDVDVKTYQLKYTAVATTHEFDVDGEKMSLKRVFADTADEKFTATGWFEQVQTPDKVGAPAA